MSSTELDPKAVATLKARAALIGVVVTVTDDDHGQPLFVATKWNMTKQLVTIEEVEVFLSRIDGRSAE